MFETMYDAPGIGLAAIQVGVPKRVLVIDLQEQEDDEGKPIRTPRTFINPELFDPSEDFSVYNEGCLSVPDQYADVERPAVVHARWLDEKGVTWKGYMDGLPSPCFHADYSPTAMPSDPYQGDSQKPPAKDYADRHNPFIYFPNIIENQARELQCMPGKGDTTGKGLRPSCRDETPTARSPRGIASAR